MTPLPFDNVLIMQDARTVRVSAEEFLALPFATRIELILTRQVHFYAGAQPVDRQAALQRLREANQSVESTHTPITVAMGEPREPGEFAVDDLSLKGVLKLRLRGVISIEKMQKFVQAYEVAVEAYAGEPYRVFCDSRELSPLSPEAASLLEYAKTRSAGRPNFRGSAVLVDSSLVSMQHRRTSTASGVSDSELVSDDEPACWAHLERTRRGLGG